jgi:hypothetical protein
VDTLGGSSAIGGLDHEACRSRLKRGRINLDLASHFDKHRNRGYCARVARAVEKCRPELCATAAATTATNVRFSFGARANSRSEERAASHPLPAPCGRWRLSSALRLRRATRPTSRRAASGLRRESHDEAKVQRTRSMTGNVAIDTKLTAEGYGGQSGSAYRRSGRFTHRESTRATGPAQAPARICRERKRRPKMRDVRNDTGGGRQRNTENDERGLSR